MCQWVETVMTGVCVCVSGWRLMTDVCVCQWVETVMTGMCVSVGGDYDD